MNVRQEYINNHDVKRHQLEQAHESFHVFESQLNRESFEVWESDMQDYNLLFFETIALIENYWDELGLTQYGKDSTIKGLYREIVDNLQSIEYQRERIA